MSDDGRPFGNALDHEHRRVDPCFMTGKGCVYTEVIDHTLKDRRRTGTRKYVGFSVMPFRKNLDVFFKNCLVPYFRDFSGSTVELDRADAVRRPGIIICEGICKRIQESDFVTIDVSLSNPNVFYEMGLAFGMGHKIVVLYHHEAPFGKKMASDLQGMGCRPVAYHDLDPILEDDFNREHNVWLNRASASPVGDDHPRVLFYEHHLDGESSAMHPPAPRDDAERLARLLLRFGDVREVMRADTEARDDIRLDFQTHVRSGVVLAIKQMCHELGDREAASADRDILKLRDYEKIKGYLKIIKGFSEVVPVKADSQFKEILDQVESSYCMIIRTGFRECHPMAYFWLGYGHARGKHVIPVTVLNRLDEGVNDLAFDIRAQRHMIFVRDAPDNFERELTTSLHQMIRADFSEWSRRRFWDRMLSKRGEVSIFTGALHAGDYGREMIGDWDLRAASELMSYFALQQYRATIESPVYTPEYPGRSPALDQEAEPAPQDSPDLDPSEREQFVREQQDRARQVNDDYVTSLKKMMTDKNCILIASPDVNPLTEIALGALYEVDTTLLFQEGHDVARFPNAMVVYKEKRPKDGGGGPPPRFFYKEEPTTCDKPRRGFKSSQLVGGHLFEKFESQLDPEVAAYEVFGHIVILRNPFRSQESSGDRYIIVLNGVSGPATFALSHVLTGGVTEEFVSYADGFEPEVRSESILSRILASISSQPFESVEFIIDVKVGRVSNDEKRLSGNTSDWRRILGWGLNERVRRPPIKIMPPKEVTGPHESLSDDAGRDLRGTDEQDAGTAAPATVSVTDGHA